MAIEQAYYFSVALINLVFAFAGTRVKEVDNKTNSIVFFVISFFAYFVSWFIYVFEVGTILETISALAASVFVWAIVVFSIKRASVNVPWPLVISIFLVNCAAQVYFIIQGQFTYYLHVSGVFLPIAFGTSGYLLLKVKIKRYPSDRIVGYAFLLMAIIIMARSVLLETSPELFAKSSMYSQIIWPAFCAILGIFALLSYTEEAQKKLYKDSHTDQLTGLFNRRMFDVKLNDCLITLASSNDVASLIYMDLDGFKPINDQHGHFVGDKVLIELSARLAKFGKHDCFVSRLGGDEFCLLTHNTGKTLLEAKKHAFNKASEIQQLLTQPIETNGLILQVNSSIGIHLLTSDSKNASVALREADNAMYLSKKSKRGKISFSEELTQFNYGIVKIGVHEIDEEHQQIDDFVQSFFHHEYELETFISQLVVMLEQHFANETQVSQKLGLNITKQHEDHHVKLIQPLKNFTGLEENVSAQDFVSHLYKQLEKHALKFDIELIQTK